MLNILFRRVQLKYILCGLLTIFFVLFFTFPNPAFSHGFGGETLPPVTVGNRNATIFFSVIPSVFDPTNDEQRILVRFFDADKDAVIEHVTYIIELKKDDQRIFRYMFHDETGNLILKINSIDSETIKIRGKQAPVLGGWMKDGINPVTLEGPIFTAGGLYEFNIEILTLDSDTNVLDERIFYNGAISVAEKTSHYVEGTAGNEYQLGITSYYDQISDFDYSKEQKKVSFTMPFDWSTENIEQVNIIHEELHIPKTFPGLLVTKYDATINGIPLPENSVVADDYSEDDRIVHIIIPKQHLLLIQDTALDVSSSEMFFSIVPNPEGALPLSAHTTSLQFQIDLWWDPLTINTDQQTKFFVDISERYVAKKEQKPITFDFVLKQEGKEIFRKTIESEVNAPPKTFFQEYMFSNEQVGPVVVSIENINNKFLASTDFMIIVEPEETPKQIIPIRLSGVKPTDDGFTEGNFYVDIIWIPSTLEINEDSEFIITIVDKKTNLPVPQAEYDFVLMTEDFEEFYRTTGFAKAEGSSFEYYQFVEKDMGNAILRIENIDQSQEFVEIPITVTPEFPFGSLLFLPLAFLIFIIFSSKFRNRFYE